MVRYDFFCCNEINLNEVPAGSKSTVVAIFNKEELILGCSDFVMYRVGIGGAAVVVVVWFWGRGLRLRFLM